ncbi:unnamed protein product [Phytophthora fragariaefolia]|uniref:Unnamed protein product n=1 Tax=Phytophthora fragariaefolia TaxID=1490495 RepID=A0A9W6YIP2_9STRA|nr:unnamed protein product [Phytophthora fragariaefolia]
MPSLASSNINRLHDGTKRTVASCLPLADPEALDQSCVIPQVGHNLAMDHFNFSGGIQAMDNTNTPDVFKKLKVFLATNGLSIEDLMKQLPA